MKLSEIRGEQALDVIAAIIEPATEIMTDKEFLDLARSRNIPKAASVAIKNHKKAVLAVLAALDGEDPETYNPSLISIPAKLVELFNDPELMDLFTPSDQSEERSSSGPQSGIIVDREA